MAYINIIPYEESEGRLREIYDDLIKKRGKLGEVHKMISLNPEMIVHHMKLYMEIMYGRSPLKRYQREMIGVVVSAANNCEYCVAHHKAALDHFWKDKTKSDLLLSNCDSLKLSDSDVALCHYAKDLTNNPKSITEEEHIRKLRESGLDDRAIMDAALVISYFNFVNRMIIGLGVNIEDDVTGYNYD